MVSKELDNKHPQVKSTNSLFENTPSKKEPNHNLFETINFNQMNEKKVVTNSKTAKEESSLFGTLSSSANKNTNKSSNDAVAKKIIKVGSTPAKLMTPVIMTRPNNKPDLLTKNESEINELKKKVNSLLEMNSKLMRRLNRQEKENAKKKKFKNNVVSFIHKYDKDVTSLKENIENSQNLVENKLTEKDEELKKLYQSTSKNFEELQGRVEKVHHKLNKLQMTERKQIEKLHTNLELQDIAVGEKLEVQGLAFLNAINAKSIDLGNIRLDSNGVIFKNENTKLIVGKEVYTIGQLLNSMKKFNILMEKCGPDFGNCKPVSQQFLQDQAAKQEAILNSLKKLRSETTEILSRHRKSR
jgi:hypothetical protein